MPMKGLRKVLSRYQCISRMWNFKRHLRTFKILFKSKFSKLQKKWINDSYLFMQFISFIKIERIMDRHFGH